MARRLKTANCCLTFRMAENMRDKLKKLSYKTLREKHVGFAFSFRRSQSFQIDDCENLTGYVVLLTEYDIAPDPDCPSEFVANYDEAFTICAIQYGEPKLCLYMEWLHYIESDGFSDPLRHSHEVYGSIYFTEMEGLKFYMEQSQHVYGGVRPKRLKDKPYRNPPEQKPPAERLRHLAIK